VAQAQRVVVIPAFYTQSENNIHHRDTEGDREIGKAKAHRGDAEARRGPGLNRGSTRMSADQEGQNLPLIDTDHPA